MQVFNITARFVAVLMFMAGVQLSMPFSLPASEDSVRDRLICLDLQNHDFTQIMESIADQAQITIKIQGYIPPGKRDIQLKQVPVDKAVEQIMRLYGIQNHAVSYITSESRIRLAMFGFPPDVLLTRQENYPSKSTLKENDCSPAGNGPEKPADRAEIVLARMNNDGSLTLEQVQMLDRQNINFLIESKGRSLTPDQILQLKEQSAQFEAE